MNCPFTSPFQFTDQTTWLFFRKLTKDLQLHSPNAELYTFRKIHQNLKAWRGQIWCGSQESTRLFSKLRGIVYTLKIIRMMTMPSIVRSSHWSAQGGSRNRKKVCGISNWSEEVNQRYLSLVSNIFKCFCLINGSQQTLYWAWNSKFDVNDLNAYGRPTWGIKEIALWGNKLPRSRLPAVQPNVRKLISTRTNEDIK